MVIDHNLAFDIDFDAATFRAQHVFQADWAGVFGDLAEQGCYAHRLAQALSVWPDACDNVPSDWHWENDERDLRGYDVQVVPAAQEQQIRAFAAA